MSIRMLGNRYDAIAFGLAGLDAVECRTRAQLVTALDEVLDDPTIALVIISPAAAALGADVIERVRDSTHPPITVVPPGPAAPADRRHAA